ncbi:MAG: serine/threonine-protein kinase [Myxococcota bacterium]
MTAQWAMAMAGDPDDVPLHGALDEVLGAFYDGATRPEELTELAQFERDLAQGRSVASLMPMLRELSHDGFLRGALVVLTSGLRRNPTDERAPALALVLARELLDALDPALGVRVARAVLADAELKSSDHRPDGVFVSGNLLLGEALLEGGDPAAALRHFEAVLSVDVDHPRALQGWSASVRSLEARGITAEHRSRGLALLDGLDELELRHAFGAERYELGRPLGRGRHAVVYEAYDRQVGRAVAIKRLLLPDARRGEVPERVLRARFFAEAKTLARVRSPFVVSLLDVQPRHRFIALDLCRGGNLRLALRRGLVGPADVPRIGQQLQAALAAVHSSAAVHRDIKPANILVRGRQRGAPVALADFGLAVGHDPSRTATNAGTLRYLAPELRLGGARATPSSDLFSAGVVLLELALAPRPLPEALDRIDVEIDARSFVPEDLPDPWPQTLTKLLDPDPEARAW